MIQLNSQGWRPSAVRRRCPAPKLRRRCIREQRRHRLEVHGRQCRRSVQEVAPMFVTVSRIDSNGTFGFLRMSSDSCRILRVVRLRPVLITSWFCRRICVKAVYGHEFAALLNLQNVRSGPTSRSTSSMMETRYVCSPLQVKTEFFLTKLLQTLFIISFYFI